QPRLGELLGDRLVDGGRGGGVEHAAAQAQLVEERPQAHEAVGGVVGPLQVAQARRQLGPRPGVELRYLFAERGLHALPQRGVAELAAGVADDDRVGVQAPASVQAVEGGHELARRQVAGDAEDDERARRRDGGSHPSSRGSGACRGFVAWPPKPWRNAATTLAAKLSAWRLAKRAYSAALMAGSGTACSTAKSTVQRPMPLSSTE